MATEDDDEELTFDTEEAPAPKVQPETEKPAEVAAPAAEPEAKPQAPAAATPSAPAAAEAKTEAKTEAKPAETAPAPSRKPSRSGMAIAACLGICVITSTVSAVQSWRAAGIAAEASASGSTKDVIAKLNALQMLVEQQRDAIDELATRPGLAAASTSPQSIDGQINALAAAVKANQEIAERLPSVVMKQVDSRLARVETKRPASAARTAARPAVQRSVTAKRAPERTADAAKVLGTPIVPVAAITEKKRPAGEAISYP